MQRRERKGQRFFPPVEQKQHYQHPYSNSSFYSDNVPPEYYWVPAFVPPQPQQFYPYTRQPTIIAIPNYFPPHACPPSKLGF